MTLKTFVFNHFNENTYVLYDDSRECVIVDAGCDSPAEQNELTAFIADHKLKPVLLLNTHGHVDHILGNNFVKKHYQLTLAAHAADAEIMAGAPLFGEIYGFMVPPPPTIDRTLEANEVISFGNSRLKVLHTPGHSPGSVCFWEEDDRILIAGDTLFQGSIGRSDLPGGDHDQLIDNIKSKLLTLPPNTEVFCGHGPQTNIAQEKAHNPFL